MQRGVIQRLIVAVLGTTLLSSVPAMGAVLYSQSFEPPVPTSSTTTGPAGFVQVNDVSGTGWQVQGGGGAGGVTLTTGVDNNGVGGSQALSSTWDHTAAAAGFFTFNQYTVYGAVAPAGVPASQVIVSLDLFMSGSETANDPIEVIIQNNGQDIAFRPTLANGAYTHVSYTLDQATNAGLFNPTMSSNLRLQHGATGFGFDANNIVRIDNVLIEAIPEPGGVALAALCGLILVNCGRHLGQQHRKN